MFARSSAVQTKLSKVRSFDYPKNLKITSVNKLNWIKLKMYFFIFSTTKVSRRISNYSNSSDLLLVTLPNEYSQYLTITILATILATF